MREGLMTNEVRDLTSAKARTLTLNYSYGVSFMQDYSSCRKNSLYLQLKAETGQLILLHES